MEQNLVALIGSNFTVNINNYFDFLSHYSKFF